MIKKTVWHIIRFIVSAIIITISSLVVRNNNTNLGTIAIVVICTTLVILIIPTLVDVIHKLLNDLDLGE